MALAGAIALGSLAIAVSAADAGGYRYGPHRGWRAGPTVGFNFGFVAPVYPAPYAYYPPPPPPPVYRVYPAYPAYPVGLTQAHVDWCSGRYQSYDPRTDTYIGWDGFAHRCIAPY